MRGLNKMVILVTGAAQGIGAAIARRLAEEGAFLALCDQNSAGVEALAIELEKGAGQALPITLDVAKRDAWEKAIIATLARFGRIDGLVNNAGVTRDKSLLKMGDEDWDLVLDVNLKGAWLRCQHVVPHLKANGGSIVNLSSESRWGQFGQSNYASAKSGLVGLTRTVALEHGRHNIRVNAVAPGTTLTEMVLAVPEDIRNGWLTNIPLQRMAEPAEIAASVAFLLSDEASYVTGQILGVNGGSAL